jgi:hypothetical protein
MKTVTLDTAAAVNEWPDDLRCWFDERELVELALDAVQTVAVQSEFFSPKPFEELSPGMLLTLMTYCYAIGMYDSENIEWAEENDATVRYICARTCPEWQTLRRFRKGNRQWIEQCLAYLLNQSRARRFAGNGDRPTGHIPVLSKNYLAALGCARRRVELAIMMDTAASD